MATWKKIIVSGSSANLANLQVDSLSSGVVTGASGNLTTRPIAGIGDIVATDGAFGNFSGSFSGSFIGDGSQLTGIATNLSFSGSGNQGGGDTINLKTENLKFEGGNNLSATVTNNTVTYNLGGSIVSSSVLTSNAQGQAVLVNNGVSGSNVDLGLQTSDDVTFNNLNLTGNAEIDGNLTVNGTLAYLNTTNTEIKDKYILLNSGSTDPDTAGLVVDQGSGAGDAFLFDATDFRWGVNKNISATTGSANTEAHISVIVDENDTNHIDEAYYQKNGNIKVDTSGDIFIYS
tara:strand:- start:910 stop:1776 length:867 start_codon:yes stop_codon:yes gene_type:complete